MSLLKTLGLILPVYWLVAAGVSSQQPYSVQAGSDPIHDSQLRPIRLGESDAGRPFEARRAPFSLLIRGDPVPTEVFFVAALPGEHLDLELDPEEERPILRYGGGNVLSTQEWGWSWKAPEEPGSYALRLERKGPSEALSLNVFVLHPFSHVESGVLNGYSIGTYQSRPLRGDSIYLPPPGFIEVSAEDEDILVSPHFTIGQFLCKQPGEPRYLALSRYLVAKLEAVLKEANDAGYEASTFHVMSGFRTPLYNGSIGNQSVYSRHLWGGAADIFLDKDGDGVMDDLNLDGRSDFADARIPFDLSERVDLGESPGIRPGGMGTYRRNAVHGPFVHVDARGRSARW